MKSPIPLKIVPSRSKFDFEAVLSERNIDLPPLGKELAASPWQFVGFKIEEFGLQGNFFQAGGASVGWAPGLTAGFRWQTLNAQGKPNDGSIKLYGDVFWPQRGTTFDNVLGINGAPQVTGAAKFTTQYWAGIKYDFGI